MRFALESQADALDAGGSEANDYSELETVDLALYRSTIYNALLLEGRGQLTVMLAPAESSTMLACRTVAALELLLPEARIHAAVRYVCMGVWEAVEGDQRSNELGVRHSDGRWVWPRDSEMAAEARGQGSAA